MFCNKSQRAVVCAELGYTFADNTRLVGHAGRQDTCAPDDFEYTVLLQSHTS